jgi:hypothetical protein
MIDGLQEDMLKITIRGLAAKLRHNKFVTFMAFILLITSIFFIQMHPCSVWYYFSAGFFLHEMVSLIVEKTKVKFLLNETISRLKKLQGAL